MVLEEKRKRILELKEQISTLKEEADYYNALQLALKLVLNGSYGALSTSYFVLFNNNVAGAITAQGRNLTNHMEIICHRYFHDLWEKDTELHNKMGIRNVRKTNKDIYNSVYCDTDSVFVSFEQAVNGCDWKNLYFNNLDKFTKTHVILTNKEIKGNQNCLGVLSKVDELKGFDLTKTDILLIDGYFVKDYELNAFLKDAPQNCKILWNWCNELDFILGIDQFRFADYLTDELKKYAATYGVENKQDFELEKISETIINIAKKKYIMHLLYEDGVKFDRLSYIFPKGIELVRSSTPLFAREKIVDIIKYLFSEPDTFNIKHLLKLIKELRREFELADIDDIAMQTSCSNYDNKVLNDKTLPLQFVTGAHFAVKSSAYYNYLLHQNPELQTRYEFIKSGTKIKYYYVDDDSINGIFAYIRGEYPKEVAPKINYDVQFSKSILSPINSIIKPLGLPEITDRLTVVMGIFGF